MEGGAFFQTIFLHGGPTQKNNWRNRRKRCLAYDPVNLQCVSLQVTAYTRVQLLYKKSRLVGGANARVHLNGRKQRRPGSLQRALNSEGNKTRNSLAVLVEVAMVCCFRLPKTDKQDQVCPQQVSDVQPGWFL
uniref:uncharacterized protein LOC124050158 isoform X2 n=1 Tax=Scatophagus argus TaxID=75038 RepID=UPI001ED8551F|nr:uncharacterized protein LOC124050158 isoform X2 [Scatophagus argus]